jgi:hypothetical protein
MLWSGVQFVSTQWIYIENIEFYCKKKQSQSQSSKSSVGCHIACATSYLNRNERRI